MARRGISPRPRRRLGLLRNLERTTTKCSRDSATPWRKSGISGRERSFDLEERPMSSFDRRHSLQASAALGGALVAPTIGRARAATTRIDAPVVDRMVVREITDNQHNIFLTPLE